VLVPGRGGEDPVSFVTRRIELPARQVDASGTPISTTILHRVIGTSCALETTIIEWPYHDVDGVRADVARRGSNVDQFEFLSIDEQSRTIHVAPGNWPVRQTMIVPGGYRIIAGPDTRLDLINGAMLVTASPLEFIGDDERPIVVTSSDSSGTGVVILQATQRSVLENVVFENLSNPSQPGWTLTSAVTFYESDVDIRGSTFTKNRCEDALNLIRCRFTIENSHFLNTQSDAFDADFCEGSISRTRFANTGNDGIDVSGSVVDITEIDVHRAGDKAVSVGEDSVATVNHLRSDGSAIAVASKDSSSLRLDNVTIVGGQVGLTAYQKKPESGPASIVATNFSITDTEVPYLIEHGSSALVNGVLVKTVPQKVEPLLYGAQYGKASD
jgi:hypothetical protein